MAVSYSSSIALGGISSGFTHNLGLQILHIPHSSIVAVTFPLCCLGQSSMTMLDCLTSLRSLRLPALELLNLGRWPRTLPFLFMDLQSMWLHYLSHNPIHMHLQPKYSSGIYTHRCLLQCHEEPLPEHRRVHRRGCWWAQIKAGGQLQLMKSLLKLQCLLGQTIRVIFHTLPFSFLGAPILKAWTEREYPQQCVESLPMRDCCGFQDYSTHVLMYLIARYFQ